MKKLLSVFVTLSMILAMLVLPTNAASDGAEIQGNEIYDTTQAVNGVLNIDGEDYIVINKANKMKFKEMTGENNYILGDDLDFSDENGNPIEWGSPDKWYGNLEGNGHKVTGFTVGNGGMFGWSDAKGENEEGVVRITNITFGGPNDLISVSLTTNYYQGLFSRAAYDRTFWFENIKAYVSVGSGYTNNYYIGGLIGELGKEKKPVNATFKNCVVDGKINGTIFLGGYIGLIGLRAGDSNVVNFINCVNSVDITANPDYRIRGGFIGTMNGTCGTVNVTNCINEGDITGGCRYVNDNYYCSRPGIAAIVGVADGGGKINVDGFLNMGKITLTAEDHTDVNGNEVAADAHVDSTGVVVGYQGTQQAIASASKVVTAYETMNDLGNPTVATADDLKSGKASFLLGEAFGQRIGVEEQPVLGGWAVVERVEGENTYYDNVYESITTADQLKQIGGNKGYRLETDLVLTEPVEISGDTDGNSTVLNLGGKTLTGNVVVVDGVLAITNGNMVSATDVAALTVKGNAVLDTKQINVSGKLGVEIVGDAAVTLGDDTVVDASDVAVFGNGANENAVLNVNGAELKVTGDAATDSALKWNALGTLNILGGTIHADGNGSAFEFLRGNAVISDGTLSGKYAITLAGAEDSTLTIDAGTLQGTAAAVLDKGNSATVLINGGTFKGTGDGAFAADGTFGASVSVVGGTFDEEIPTAYLHEYVSVKNEDGSYSVRYHDHDYTDCEYESINSGSHKKFCTVCNEAITEAHSWGAYVDDGEGGHYQTCTGCGREGAHRDHVEEIDEATGNTVCSVCDSVITVAQTETQASTDSNDSTDSDDDEGKGCMSTVSYAMVLVVMLAACGFVFKEEKEKGCERL